MKIRRKYGFLTPKGLNGFNIRDRGRSKAVPFSFMHKMLDKM